MNVIQVREGCAEIAFNLDELSGISNSLNEAIGTIDDWEFETRVGISKAEARTLIHAIGKAIALLSDRVP